MPEPGPTGFPAQSQTPFLLSSPISEKGFFLVTVTGAFAFVSRTQQPRNPYLRPEVLGLGAEASICPPLAGARRAGHPGSQSKTGAILLWNGIDSVQAQPWMLGLW